MVIGERMSADGAPRSFSPLPSSAAGTLLTALLVLLLHSSADAAPAGAVDKREVPFARAASSHRVEGIRGAPPQTPRQLHRAVWGLGWSEEEDESAVADDDAEQERERGDGGGGWGGTAGVGGTRHHRHELWRRHRGGMFARGEGRWRHATRALAKYVQVQRGIVASAAASLHARTAAATTAAAGAGVDDVGVDDDAKNGIGETTAVAPPGPRGGGGERRRGGGGSGGGRGVGGRHPARFMVWHGAGITGVPFARRLQAASSTLALALATGRAFMIDDPVLVRRATHSAVVSKNIEKK